MTPKPAAKIIIAVDIDDVISSQTENIRLFANRRYGLKHSSSDYKVAIKDSYWNYWGEVWGVTKDEQDRRVEEYVQDGELFSQRVEPGAIDALSELKKKHGLVVVTSRTDTHVKDTHRWLDKHFKATFEGVHFARVWESGRRESKANICKKVGAKYLIDDHPDHCNLAAEEGIKALLYGDYGWSNGSKLHPNVTRVKNWKEVLEFFENEKSR